MVQAGNSQSERRAAERFRVSLTAETDKGPGVTRDVSVSGLCLITGWHLDVGEQLDVVLTMPDRDDIADSVQVQFALRGSVVWAEPGSGAVGMLILPDEESRRVAWVS